MGLGFTTTKALKKFTTKIKAIVIPIPIEISTIVIPS